MQEQPGSSRYPPPYREISQEFGSLQRAENPAFIFQLAGLTTEDQQTIQTNFTLITVHVRIQ
jgi:hypothetical protein